MIGKRLRKKIQLFSIFCILKEKKYIQLTSQKLIRIVPTLLRAIASKHYGHFYFLNYLHSFRTENKIKSHENVRKNKDFCGIVMPLEKDIILEFNQYVKSDKIPYILYAGIESLVRKTDECANNPENSSTTKIGKHIPCEYSMSSIWQFDHR